MNVYSFSPEEYMLLQYKVELCCGFVTESSWVNGAPYSSCSTYRPPWSCNVPLQYHQCQVCPSSAFSYSAYLTKLCHPSWVCCSSYAASSAHAVELLSVCPVVAGVTWVEGLVWCNVHVAVGVAVATRLADVYSVIKDNWTSHHKCFTFCNS